MPFFSHDRHAEANKTLQYGKTQFKTMEGTLINSGVLTEQL